MRKAVINSASVLFGIMMLLLASCKTQEPPVCKATPSAVAEVKINSEAYRFNIYDYQTGKQGKSDADFSLALTSNKMPPAEFNSIQFLKDLFSTELNSNTIMTAIFFTSNESNEGRINEEKVGAVAIYYKANGKLKMAVYKRNTASEKMVMDGYAYETRQIRIEDFYKIDRKVKTANSMLAGHNTVYVVTSDNFKESEYKDLRSNTKNRFDIYYHVYNNAAFLLERKGMSTRTQFPMPDHNTLTCGGLCATPQIKGNCIYEQGSGAPICDEPVNPDKCEKSEGIDKQTSIAAGKEIDDALHGVRDKVLSMSAFGYHTVASYYYCSAELDGKVNVSLAIKTAKLIVNVVYPAAQKLNDPHVQTNTSLFMTDGDINALIDLCTDIKALSTDPTFVFLMDENIANLEFCKGKTTSEIYLALK